MNVRHIIEEVEEENIERNFQNIDEISQHLKCTICQEVFDNPHRVKCG